MNRILYFVWLSFIVIFYGCNSTTKKTEVKIIEREGKLMEYIYINNNLKEQNALSPDSVKNGRSLKYYDNGEVKRESNYVNGILDGYEFEYFENGNIKSRKVWEKGILFGEHEEYFDGITEIYREINEEGDTVDAKQPLVRLYSVHGLDGQIAYQREYDSAGKLLNETGSTILFTKLESFEITKQDTLDIQFYIASPDWVTREFYVEKYNTYGELLSIEQQEINENYNAAFYRTTFELSGKYQIKGISKFVDDLSDNIKTDTVTIDITVKAISTI